MKDYSSAEIRNFAVVGHGASGKTLLTEAMLVCSGRQGRIGSIDKGSTVSDYHADEKEHRISIHSSLLHTEWMERKFNIIDTPGYLDFISDALGTLRVGDFALVTVGANQGVQVGTEQVWEYAGHYGIPRVVVVNGCDRENISFEESLDDLRAHFGPTVFPMAIPLDAGPGFHRVLDVLRSEVVSYKTDGSGTYTEEKAEGPERARVKELHRELIEHIAEADDTLLEKFFENDGLTEDELRAGCHAALQAESFIPVFACSALTNIGVARLMDFIAKYGSSPVDRKKVPAHDDSGTGLEVSLTDTDPVAFVFKTISEPHVGDLSFFRVYSGTVKTGMDMYNATRGRAERLGQLCFLHGSHRTNVDHVGPGDIGAVVKLKDTHTGNTLCAPGKTVILPPVNYPSPSIHGALQLASKGDEEKIATGLAVLHEEDPTFLYRVDGELGQTVLSGQGEVHLQVITEALKNRFGVDVTLTEPKVPFRETILKPSEAKYRHKKQSGGAGQFAEVWMRIAPAERDAGVDFHESLVGTNVDRVFVPSVEKGVQQACTEGILAGYRVTDVRVDFYDGKMHPVDSKDIAFQIAGHEAFREAFLQARPALLEPILAVDIVCEEGDVGDILGDLSSRRGKVLGLDSENGKQVIHAQVPQAEMYRYSTRLRSLTGGRARHTERFSHYEQVQPDLQDKLLARMKEQAGPSNGHNGKH